MDHEPAAEWITPRAPLKLPLVQALQSVLRIPRSASQDATLPFVAFRGGRRIVGHCHSTNRADLVHTFTPSTFTLSCALVPEQDQIPRVLSAKGIGSWANYQFVGALQTSSAAIALRSQSVSVMGAGVIRGFEFLRGDKQVAAVSFQSKPSSYERDAPYLPEAWLQSLPLQPDDDALVAAVALAYAYPWPTHCDVGVLSKTVK